jgi:CRP-like cAMP-binding protein
MIPKHQNRLLSAQSDELYERVAPHLTQVSLEQGAILHQPGDVIQQVYFPLNCLLSITTTMENGATVETGMVGNREVLGINALLSDRPTTQTTYVVQVPGEAFKSNAEPLRKIFDENKELRDIVLNYTQALLAQLSQTTACNRLHVIDQRLARWLLGVQERINSDEIALTQWFLSDMLGVRRAGITQAAQKLQREGLIKYHQGHIKILDQEGLRARTCECFYVVQNEYDRLLGGRPSD